MFQQKQIITIILIAVIFFVLGYALNGNGGVSVRGVNSGEDSFQAGWEAAKKRLAETGFGPISGMGMEVRFISGNIQEVKNDKITIKINPLEPLADPNLDTRIIGLSHTKIYKMVERDPVQYQKEMNEFNEKMQEQINNPSTNGGVMPEPLIPPEMFNKQEVDISELQVGQQISITTKEDIREIKQFEAEEITIQSNPNFSGAVEMAH